MSSDLPRQGFSALLVGLFIDGLQVRGLWATLFSFSALLVGLFIDGKS